ncbi:hypothetical protein [Paracoccus sp. (in: a-proteobacteria)]|uniref:hypothetical protein n=1 Tax=Paracoccus sp. TaxID=267 RepID=UPI00322057B2
MSGAPGPAGRAYVIGPQLARDAEVRPYVSRADLPLGWRSLRVFAVDPSLSASEGEVHVIRVPYEPLAPGPEGGLFAVDMRVGEGGTCYRKVDLDDPDLLRRQGVTPDEADARFHGQMVYGIASLTYEAFRKALGRQPGWAFDPARPGQPSRLLLVPFAMAEANAYYSRSRGSISFGYAQSGGGRWSGDLPPDVTFFTSLSSDIVTHEVTHAILDGLRPHFAEATSADGPAFHEAFADLMAIFQRFEFEPFVRSQIRRANGDLALDTLLNVIAPEIGYLEGEPFGVRRFMAQRGEEAANAGGGRAMPVGLDRVGEDTHARGAVLAEAVFEAFVTIARRRTVRLIRLATGGRERLAEGELSPELLDEICLVSRKVAEQFRRICIRAMDYCPPVDITFGDYLRAMITADAVLVRDDPLNYREALVDAFRRRRIYPGNVATMSAHSLVWNPPQRPLPAIAELSLDRLRFDGDPGAVPRPQDAAYHAGCLGDAIAASPALRRELGLLPPAEAGPFEIASLRPTRRAGPDGQIAFDLVAEVVQRRMVALPDGREAPFRGGATLILDAWGQIQFVIRKGVASREREEKALGYMTGAGAGYWTGAQRLQAVEDLFHRFCLRRPEDGAP